jgi:hypothetical protein
LLESLSKDHGQGSCPLGIRFLQDLLQVLMEKVPRGRSLGPRENTNAGHSTLIAPGVLPHVLHEIQSILVAMGGEKAECPEPEVVVGPRNQLQAGRSEILGQGLFPERPA